MVCGDGTSDPRMPRICRELSNSDMAPNPYMRSKLRPPLNPMCHHSCSLKQDGPACKPHWVPHGRGSDVGVCHVGGDTPFCEVPPYFARHDLERETYGGDLETGSTPQGSTPAQTCKVGRRTPKRGGVPRRCFFDHKREKLLGYLKIQDLSAPMSGVPPLLCAPKSRGDPIGGICHTDGTSRTGPAEI